MSAVFAHRGVKVRRVGARVLRVFDRQVEPNENKFTDPKKNLQIRREIYGFEEEFKDMQRMDGFEEGFTDSKKNGRIRRRFY